MDVLQEVFTLTLALSHQGRGDIAEVTYPCQPTRGEGVWLEPFQSPPASAHGELVEPSATVLRQAQDERVVNFHNLEQPWGLALAYWVKGWPTRFQ